MSDNKSTIHSLTGLRGVLSIWVLLLHLLTGLMIIKIPVNDFLPTWIFSFINSGYWAVDCFFLLSGFVLSYSYTESLIQNFDFKTILSYLLNRLYRIYPIHFTIICGYAILLALAPKGLEQECVITIPMPVTCKANVLEIAIGSTNCQREHAPEKCERFSSDQLISNLLMVNSWNWQKSLGWNHISWSISSEWAAYILFPFLLLFFSRLTRGPGIFVAFLLAYIGMMSVLYWGGYAPRGSDPELGLVRLGGCFLMGCASYRFFIHPYFKRVKWNLVGLGSLAILLFFSDTWLKWGFPIFLCSLILSLTSSQAYLSKILSKKPMVWLGHISYSLYMSHLFTFELLGIIAGTEPMPVSQIGLLEIMGMSVGMIFAAIVIATILYYAIEKPCHRYLKSIQWPL